MAYLQNRPPDIPTLPPPNPGSNTTNTAYRASDIHNVGVWTNFNLATIRQRYQAHLTTTTLQPDPFPVSPPQPINSENPLRHRISDMLITSLAVSILMFNGVLISLPCAAPHKWVAMNRG
jgi:hypothetical protein